MSVNTIHDKASVFRALHQREQILVLLNAWDAASARLFEAAGAPAIATTSSGVANSLGYPDGEAVPWKLQVHQIQLIAHAVSVPVTADIESGFASTVDQLKANIAEVIAAGAVGINLEDAHHGPSANPLFTRDEQYARISAAREAAGHAGVHLFINARTDVFLEKVRAEDPAWQIAETLERARLFASAGADSIFVPGVTDREIIRQLAAEIMLPLNILATTGTPGISDLRELGVKRVSIGSGAARATLTLARKIAAELLDSGTYGFLEGAIPFAEMNALFSNRKV